MSLGECTVKRLLYNIEVTVTLLCNLTAKRGEKRLVRKEGGTPQRWEGSRVRWGCRARGGIGFMARHVWRASQTKTAPSGEWRQRWKVKTHTHRFACCYHPKPITVMTGRLSGLQISPYSSPWIYLLVRHSSNYLVKKKSINRISN